jgi:hypothetical protein
LNGEPIEEDEKGKLIDFYELNNFLQENLKIKKTKKEVGN